MTRRVVVTGLGVATPLGCELEEAWSRWCAGEAGVTVPRRVAEGRPPTRAVGEVAERDVARLREEFAEGAESGRGAETADLRTVFAVAAARRAVADAGLAPGPHPRGACAIASGPGAHRLEDQVAFLGADGRFDARAFAAATSRLHPGSLLRNAADRPATEVARRHGLGGGVEAAVTACAASISAIGTGLRASRTGRADLVVAGGADSMVDPLGLVFFVLLGAAAAEEGPTACRPFSRRRTGIVTGEGAGIAVLEAEEHARARGARVYAEVAGYGSSFDAYRVTAPHPAGRGAAQAMARALADASLEPGDVDLVAAHATGTKLNDPAEAKAIRAVFGPHADRVAVSSNKSMMGHLLAAAGAVSFVSAALSVARDRIPPTIHLEDVDPACALDHVVGKARDATVRAALVNGLAFGGHNATIALTKPPSGALRTPRGAAAR